MVGPDALIPVGHQVALNVTFQHPLGRHDLAIVLTDVLLHSPTQLPGIAGQHQLALLEPAHHSFECRSK
jgi:hypothetical protein